MEIVAEDQGYLFPDTYYFDEYNTSEEIKVILSDNFVKKVGKIDNSKLIMASILEEDASSSKDREIISGILWKRISIGMPLQVDVATTTYKERGLPSEPISNPGLDAIRAALEPVESPFLYYISDEAGFNHYATDLEGHNQNIAEFLE